MSRSAAIILRDDALALIRRERTGREMVFPAGLSEPVRRARREAWPDGIARFHEAT